MAKRPATAPSADVAQLFSVKPAPFTMSNGEQVHVRRLSAEMRLAWIERVIETAANYSARVAQSDTAAIIVLALCRADGTPVFQPGQEADVPEIIDHPLMEELSDEIMRVNAIGEKGRAELQKKLKGEPLASNS